MIIFKNKKNLSSHSENHFFCHETLIFNYGHTINIFEGKYLDFSKMDKNKCPFSNFQKTFHLKNIYFHFDCRDRFFTIF